MRRTPQLRHRFVHPPRAAGLVVLALTAACARDATAPPAPPPAAVASIDLAPERVLLALGGTRRLEATPRGRDGQPLADRPVTWGSRDTSIAGVAADGTVHARAAGATTVVATSGGVSQEAEVVVASPAPACAHHGQQPLALNVGEAARLTASDVACLWLTGPRTARYALAFADGRGIEAARTGPEPLDIADVAITVTPLGTTRTARAGVTPSNASVAAVAAPARGPRSDVAVLAATLADADAPSLADAFFLRTASLRAGDAVQFYDESLRRARSARALRQYDGGRVILLLADGAVDPPSVSWFAGLDSAMLWLLADGLPVLRRTLHDWTPTTSPAAGQFYIVLDPTLHTFATSGLASAYERMEGVAGVPAMVFIDPSVVRTSAATFTLLAHELTHAFQYQYLRAAAPGDLWTYRTQWAQEGTADLVAYELLRRHVGQPLLGNAEWPPVGTDGPGLLSGLLYVNGRFRDGYRQSASFLFDLYARRVRAGESSDAALRDVARGALDSWHGVGPARPGLVSRMTTALGAPWDPVDALLTWTLSQAVDDRTSSARFQNFMFREAWRRPPRLTTWEPLATLGDGAGPVRVRQQGGGVGYLLLNDATVRVTSDAPSLRWMVVRYE